MTLQQKLDILLSAGVTILLKKKKNGKFSYRMIATNKNAVDLVDFIEIEQEISSIKDLGNERKCIFSDTVKYLLSQKI